MELQGNDIDIINTDERKIFTNFAFLCILQANVLGLTARLTQQRLFRLVHWIMQEAENTTGFTKEPWHVCAGKTTPSALNLLKRFWLKILSTRRDEKEKGFKGFVRSEMTYRGNLFTVALQPLFHFFVFLLSRLLFRSNLAVTLVCLISIFSF